MWTNPSSSKKVEVTMLGEFSITINGHQLTNLKGRTKRVWMLIEYLLANRHKDIPIEMLTEVLWGEDECKDPLNALKNLVYRARELLKGLSQNPNEQYIQYIRNTYTWNNSYPSIIDTEQLVFFWKQGCDSSESDESRIDAFKKAIALYRGEFLPKSLYSRWVILQGTYYATVYNECILKSCGLLIDHHRYDEVVTICEAALSLTPLEESIHKVLLFAYISNGKRNKALDHYNYVIDLFYRELGVNIADSLRPLYKKLINSINQVEMDLGVIKGDLNEVAAQSGAFYCDYDVFKSIYRMQARSIMRTGQSIFIVLFTVRDLNGVPPKSEVSKLAFDRLKYAILESLRKGDMVASYSSTQYIVMIPVINYENAAMVTERILQRFHFRYRKDDVKVTTRINTLDSLE